MTLTDWLDLDDLSEPEIRGHMDTEEWVVVEVPGLLKTHEVARLFGVHVNTVRNWANAGILHPVILPRGHRRYDPKEIERMRLGMQPRDEPQP